ncbi:PAS domain S-box protein [Terasakiella sp. SH-1]|uniref:PAS domain S-box protein n=1 Tax=Terasakiella sp. SH-1 TaxID=2560057 RepID=UPI00107367ED|nr:PAS domain S-box protein [Terasakiella sp. SH-1]
MKLTSKTIFLLINIMIVIVVFSVGVVFTTWYQTEVEHEKGRLVEIVQSRARMIESIAKYDRMEGQRLQRPEAQSDANTLLQVREAHLNFKGFGETGEFTLAKKEDDKIIFLLRHRHETQMNPEQVIRINDKIAEPMLAALNGKSGIMTGLDYRGSEVLAAYEHVKILNMGIVAKVDWAEIHDPFVQAGFRIALIAIVIIFAGAFFFQRTSAPLIRVIERNEELLSQVMNGTDDIVVSKDLRGKITFINRAGEDLFQAEGRAIVGQNICQFLPQVVLDKLLISDQELAETGKSNFFVSELAVNGKNNIYHTQQSAIKTDDDIQTGTVCIARNVTESFEKNRLFAENKALTDAIVNNAADGIILLDNLGHIVVWNKAATKILGYSREEVTGKSPHDFLTCDSDREKAREGLSSFVESGFLHTEGEVLELKARCKDGGIIDIELSLAALKKDDRWSALAIFRDISSKKEAEHALHRVYDALAESASKYKSLFDNAKISIWDEDFTEVYKTLEEIRSSGVRDIKVYLHANLDKAFELAQKIKINDVNEETLLMYGAKSKQQFYSSISETFSGDAIDIFIDEIDAIWRQESGFVSTATQRKLDGSILYVMIYVPIPTQPDDYKNIPVSILDVTETVLTKERLNQQKDALTELQTIVDRSPAVAFLWKNEEGWPVEYVSSNVSEWGYRKEQFESREIMFADIVEPSDLERVGGEVRRHIDNNDASFVQEYRIKMPDGTLRWIDDRTWVRRNRKGEITHFEGVCLDITDRKEVERLLWQSQKSEALGNMAAGIAHDFNNMLLPVIALADLTANQLEEESPLQKRMVKIKDAGEKAQELVKSLMIFAREEEVSFDEIEVVDLLETTVELLEQTMPSSMQISFEAGCSDKVNNCQSCMIEGSFGQLQSVLINIAKNAADALHGRTGSFDIQCDLVGKTELESDPDFEIVADQYFHIRLKDNGPGMSESTLNRIFDPFFTTKAVGEGTGMGLAMARSIVEKHQGRIKANSRIGFGTTFDILLPKKG